MSDKICIHIDPTSNTVLARGLSSADFVAAVHHQPDNLLLLDAGNIHGEYERYTGLKIIRGQESSMKYLASLSRPAASREIKWIDFSDFNMLKELTPIEISELLYLGHTKTHLRSPFFYKLQNNFVYFEFNGDSTRIYYRYLEEFYQILAKKITQISEQKLNEKRSFFKKGPTVEPLDTSLLHDLKSIFQEGVCFSYEKSETRNGEFRIPIYIVEDRFWHKTITTPAKEHLVAMIVYHLKAKTWSLKIDENDLGMFDTLKAN